MSAKLDRNLLPSGHTRDDFKAFGPVVTKDTTWGNSRMCDLGCFQQDGVDSNKYYHLSVVQSTKTGKWYAYFEWGRTRTDGRPDKPAFQFYECSNEQEAVGICEDQFHEKNTKRGMWQKIGSKERYVSKPNKDCYVVRPTASRLVGLPCAEKIANQDAKGSLTETVAEVAKPKTSAKKKSRLDPHTHKLFQDLIGGAVKYTNAVMTGGKGVATLPTAHALEEARTILDDAMACVKRIGKDINDQVNDRELKSLTYNLYGLIPKHKPAGASESTWILSQDNISGWRLDIDTFETALQATGMDIEEDETDIMAGIPADVSWIDPNSTLGTWLKSWWTKATRNRHGHIGDLKIHNMWVVERHNDRKIMRSAQEMTLGEMPSNWNNERPLHQDKSRPDLNVAERKLFHATNTALMFHGTRSVNVPGIIRENLRFPNQLTGVIITGAMFGPGNYWADDFKKSAGYCSNPHANSRSYYGGGGEVAGRHAFMFAGDVICGHPYVAPDAYGFTEPPKPHHCVFGKAGHTASWGRSGGLLNNEWIIYKKGRTELRYLAEISW